MIGLFDKTDTSLPKLPRLKTHEMSLFTAHVNSFLKIYGHFALHCFFTVLLQA